MIKKKKRFQQICGCWLSVLDFGNTSELVGAQWVVGAQWSTRAMLEASVSVCGRTVRSQEKTHSNQSTRAEIQKCSPPG